MNIHNYQGDMYFFPDYKILELNDFIHIFTFSKQDSPK